MLPSRRWWPPRGVAADRLVAAGLALAGAVEAGTAPLDGADRTLAVAGAVVTASLLAWRRTHAASVSIAQFALLPVLDAGGVAIEDLVVPFVAWMLGLFSAGQYAATKRAWLALGVALALVWSDVAMAGQPVEDLVYAGSIVAFAWATGRMLRARVLQVAALADDAARQALEAEAREQASLEAERRRLARELHDVISHGVTAMAVQAGAATSQPPETAREMLLGIQALGRETQSELVRLLGFLRDDHAEIGLAPQPTARDLATLIDRMRTTGACIELVEVGDRPDVPAGPGLAVYRIVQEAVTNARRHADGAPVRVRLTWSPVAAEILVVNGPGRSATTTSAGHGLAGMRERVALYGGSLEAGPTPDGGWRVHAALPLRGSVPVP